MWRGKLIHALLGPQVPATARHGRRTHVCPLPRSTSRGVSVNSSAARGRIYISREGPKALDGCFSPPSVFTIIISPGYLVPSTPKTTTTTILPLSRLDIDIVHSTVFASAFSSSSSSSSSSYSSSYSS
ncbi:uncharacterized protein LY79DRAFT_658618 [Colletotrichum navitas]|uniref:Uncharacterized protein n=1 Tax=Colletotrichum navitas TaxID=681940 RepID=A0AAD8V6X0_9PEZI|nr:uncharacterized protein LY79DRAFT_658618 [Colletotrichum navitas]KAK1594021.1 hypothetical protein LY79DRAFT_658618 [Colletotrichum navitas]